MEETTMTMTERERELLEDVKDAIYWSDWDFLSYALAGDKGALRQLESALSGEALSTEDEDHEDPLEVLAEIQEQLHDMSGLLEELIGEVTPRWQEASPDAGPTAVAGLAEAATSNA
jgi:hypothetical protein